MGKPTNGRTRLNTWRGGLVLIGVGSAVLLSGCHGHGHYRYHGGHHGFHGHYGHHGYHGNDWLLPVLAIWALLHVFG
ncbi:MAG: hypothetical protein NCW75_15425 [Phycisphaera sp.]|nr:MAG: hypothetical protein NCW75_15425 [Phycisphaera sp.]